MNSLILNVQNLINLKGLLTTFACITSLILRVYRKRAANTDPVIHCLLPNYITLLTTTIKLSIINQVSDSVLISSLHTKEYSVLKTDIPYNCVRFVY